MAVIFHEADDDHAPFPHRVVIGSAKSEFVICANCDHWIMRDVSGCDCEYRCHALGALLCEIEVHAVESKKLPRRGAKSREARS